MMSPLRSWSLRGRLTLGVLLLTAFGFLLSSIVVKNALEGYLIGQVDQQLLTLSATALPQIAESGIIQDEDDFSGRHND